VRKKRQAVCDWCRDGGGEKQYPAVAAITLKQGRKRPEKIRLCWVHAHKFLRDWDYLFLVSWLTDLGVELKGRKVFKVEFAGPLFNITGLTRKLFSESKK